jgi:hypothetical protein
VHYSHDGRFQYPRTIPASVPGGKVLVHNSATPTRHQGWRGFCYWLQAPDAERRTRCNCGWGDGIEHYRVNSGTS